MLAQITNVEQLEDTLSEPSDGVVKTLGELDGDIIVLGAGGKMGPTLARMAKQASDRAGVSRRVIAVDLFPTPEVEANLRAHGVETLRC
ncbi:MAG: epimerase, partial [Armatimonadota bacterium]